MIKRGFEPQPSPSLATSDPLARLANAILLKAAHDVKQLDILQAADSLCFWLDPFGAAIWLDALGYEITKTKVLMALVGGDNATTKRCYIRAIKDHVPKPGGALRPRIRAKHPRPGRAGRRESAGTVTP